MSSIQRPGMVIYLELFKYSKNPCRVKCFSIPVIEKSRLSKSANPTPLGEGVLDP